MPLVVITGPTASGKTGLAIEIAKKCDGEIICADSRTVYKYLDIGTAKPTKEEQKMVKHWAIDLIEPNERYSVSDFQKYAYQKIDDIRSRGKIPFLVGGTGLYVDAVIFNYQFVSRPDDTLRDNLNKMSLDELHEYCRVNSIELPENKLNKRYVIRSIERNNRCGSKLREPIDNTYVVGIATDKDMLKRRIEARAEQIVCPESVQEAIKVSTKYGWSNEAMTSNVYPLLKKYIDGEASLDDVIKASSTTDWHLAKRQLTWMRRNTYINWLELDEARRYLIKLLDI